MFQLNRISKGLVKGRGSFLSFAPGPIAVLKPKYAKIAGRAMMAYGLSKQLKQHKPLEDIIGQGIGMDLLARTGKTRINKWLSRTSRALGNREFNLSWRGLNKVSRTWYTDNDKSSFDDRIIRKLTVVYHDADKAQKHLDVHLGHLSLVYRVTGKPVENQIKFNSKGELTQGAKDALIQHLRSEFKNNSRVPWNHDHSVSNARCSWLLHSRESTSGYGAGPTRQLVASGYVEFYHPSVRSSLHFYAPIFNSSQGMYLYQLYPGTEKKAPILVCGNLIPRDQNFKDRLHLKMIKDEEFYDKFIPRIDKETVTRKYDGASTYFSSNGQGFKFFSPRESKVTGHRIEYTFKVPELADKTSQSEPVGMGELLFWRKTPIGWLTWLLGFRGLEKICWKYSTAAEVGGVLNAAKVRKRYLFPELRTYRMDKWNGKDVQFLPFHTNRELQCRLEKEVKSPFWRMVKKGPLMKVDGWEGLVAVPAGLSVNEGIKIKWWEDANDWEVVDVKFGISSKGAIDGVVSFRSLESDRTFKLGPGQMGSAEQCLDILQNPDNYVGRVAKVASRRGHEGRAAKFTGEWHPDKGKG